MSTILGIAALYMAFAAIFYLRLTATATDGLTPVSPKPSRWHRAKRLTAAFLRRVRSAVPKR